MEKYLQIQRTKENINISLYYLLKRRNYDEITVKDICEKANISRMTFYRYFDKKDDIIVEYCDERFADFYEEIQKSIEISEQELFYAVFLYFKKYYRQLLILKKANKQDLLINQFDSYIRYIIAKIPIKRINKNNPIVIPFFSGGFYNVLMNWLDNNMEKSPEEMSKHLLEMFE